jgi:hypothetical protein
LGETAAEPSSFGLIIKNVPAANRPRPRNRLAAAFSIYPWPSYSELDNLGVPSTSLKIEDEDDDEYDLVPRTHADTPPRPNAATVSIPNLHIFRYTFF